MEVIEIEANNSKTGRYNEEKLLKAIQEAIQATKKTGKVSGFHLKDFLKEVYSGDKPNLGALRKKCQELGYKHRIGDVKLTIKEKENLIGFYLRK